jgi:hypothetical protein
MKIRMFACFAAAVAFASSATAQVTSARDRTIFRDAGRKIEVTYDFTAEGIEFSARLLAGWSFEVNIDGDQNGVWGAGPLAGIPSATESPDRSFGRDVNGSFCAQYIQSSFPQDPGQIRVKSDCDGYPSKGSVEIGQMDGQRRATYTLKVPLADIFGSQADAHLQVCLWDMERLSCQFTLAKPFILARPRTPGRQKG